MVFGGDLMFWEFAFVFVEMRYSFVDFLVSFGKCFAGLVLWCRLIGAAAVEIWSVILWVEGVGRCGFPYRPLDLLWRGDISASCWGLECCVVFGFLCGGVGFWGGCVGFCGGLCGVGGGVCGLCGGGVGGVVGGVVFVCWFGLLGMFGWKGLFLYVGWVVGFWWCGVWCLVWGFGGLLVCCLGLGCDGIGWGCCDVKGLVV